MALVNLVVIIKKQKQKRLHIKHNITDPLIYIVRYPLFLPYTSQKQN